jgi:hypothetical protein
MGDVADSAERSGKHAAPRHAAPRTGREEPVRLDAHRLPTVARTPAAPRRSTGPLLLLALGITAAVVAWGYLVYLAIDFGTTARNGDSTAWWFLALATVGAIACLFVGMMLGTRLVDRIRAGTPPPAPRPPGGHRVAR